MQASARHMLVVLVLVLLTVADTVLIGVLMWCVCVCSREPVHHAAIPVLYPYFP